MRGCWLRLSPMMHEQGAIFCPETPGAAHGIVRELVHANATAAQRNDKILARGDAQAQRKGKVAHLFDAGSQCTTCIKSQREGRAVGMQLEAVDSPSATAAREIGSSTPVSGTMKASHCSNRNVQNPCKTDNSFVLIKSALIADAPTALHLAPDLHECAPGSEALDPVVEEHPNGSGLSADGRVTVTLIPKRAKVAEDTLNSASTKRAGKTPASEQQEQSEARRTTREGSDLTCALSQPAELTALWDSVRNAFAAAETHREKSELPLPRGGAARGAATAAAQDSRRSSGCDDSASSNISISVQHFFGHPSSSSAESPSRAAGAHCGLRRSLRRARSLGSQPREGSFDFGVAPAPSGRPSSSEATNALPDVVENKPAPVRTDTLAPSPHAAGGTATSCFGADRRSSSPLSWMMAGNDPNEASLSVHSTTSSQFFSGMLIPRRGSPSASVVQDAAEQLDSAACDEEGLLFGAVPELPSLRVPKRVTDTRSSFGNSTSSLQGRTAVHKGDEDPSLEHRPHKGSGHLIGIISPRSRAEAQPLPRSGVANARCQHIEAAHKMLVDGIRQASAPAALMRWSASSLWAGSKHMQALLRSSSGGMMLHKPTEHDWADHWPSRVAEPTKQRLAALLSFQQTTQLGAEPTCNNNVYENCIPSAIANSIRECAAPDDAALANRHASGPAPPSDAKTARDLGAGATHTRAAEDGGGPAQMQATAAAPPLPAQGVGAVKDRASSAPLWAALGAKENVCTCGHAVLSSMSDDEDRDGDGHSACICTARVLLAGSTASPPAAPTSMANQRADRANSARVTTSVVSSLRMASAPQRTRLGQRFRRRPQCGGPPQSG